MVPDINGIVEEESVLRGPLEEEAVLRGPVEEESVLRGNDLIVPVGCACCKHTLRA